MNLSFSYLSCAFSGHWCKLDPKDSQIFLILVCNRSPWADPNQSVGNCNEISSIYKHSRTWKKMTNAVFCTYWRLSLSGSSISAYFMYKLPRVARNNTRSNTENFSRGTTPVTKPSRTPLYAEVWSASSSPINGVLSRPRRPSPPKFSIAWYVDYCISRYRKTLCIRAYLRKEVVVLFQHESEFHQIIVRSRQIVLIATELF